jgi:arginine transport system permease protein
MSEPFLAYFLQLASGVGMTVVLMLATLITGGFLAGLMTLVLVSDHVVLKKCVSGFIFFIRGTPLLVQIFLIYFGLGQFDWLRDSPVWFVLREPLWCAVIALACNTSAYTTVLWKGAIDAVPAGEVLACKALGMSRRLRYTRLIFPRAMRMVLPAYSNEVIIILKSTSLVSTITLLDLMGVTNQLIAQTYQTLPFLTLAAGIYLTFNVIIISVFKKIERSANRYLLV